MSELQRVQVHRSLELPYLGNNWPVNLGLDALEVSRLLPLPAGSGPKGDASYCDAADSDCRDSAEARRLRYVSRNHVESNGGWDTMSLVCLISMACT